MGEVRLVHVLALSVGLISFNCLPFFLSFSSESSSTSGTESDEEQDNRIVKSYSMEDLRFYYG